MAYLRAESNEEMGEICPRPPASTPSRKVRVLGARVAEKSRRYFVVVLELGITKPCGLRLVSTVFRSKRHPPEVVLAGPKQAGADGADFPQPPASR